MDNISDDITLKLLSYLGYSDLINFALVQRSHLVLINYYLAQVARRARKVLSLDESLSNIDIVERMCHVAGDTTTFDAITVVDGNWSGPKGNIVFGNPTLWKRTADGKLHRTDGPAQICYYSGGRPITEHWYTDGVLWRIDNYYASGQVRDQSWFLGGRSHRSGGPADITYHPDGQIASQCWYVNGKKHRTDGPAEIHYFDNGQPCVKFYFVHGRKHRTDGPAGVFYFKSGKVCVRVWFVNGYQHRTDGPAEIEYNENGRTCIQRWYVDGCKILNGRTC